MELIFYWPENPVYRATGSAAAEAVPQPKQCHRFLEGVTTRLAVSSSWNALADEVFAGLLAGDTGTLYQAFDRYLHL